MAQIYKRIIVRTDPTIKYPFEVLPDCLTVPVLLGYQYTIGLIDSGAITQIVHNTPNELTDEISVVFNTKADLTAYLANENNLENSYIALRLIDADYVAYCATNNMVTTYRSGSFPIPEGIIITRDALASLVATLP